MNEGERFRFTQAERVTGERRIETLFAQGRSFMAYPFRVVFLQTVSSPSRSLSVLISIPKKKLKSAVHRNRMKRLVREAYRLNKTLFDDTLLPENGHIDIAFIYVKDELSEYPVVEKGIKKAMRELMQNIRKEEC